VKFKVISSRSIVFSVFAGACALSGCKSSETTKPAAKPANSAPESVETAPPPAPRTTPAAADSELKIKWDDPEGWQRVKPSSSMRKASYKIPPVAGESAPAELAVFYFGSEQGGTVEANMKRWVGQFKGVKDSDVQRSERSANGLTQHVIRIVSGDFAAGMFGPAKAKPGYGLLGAVVESPSGMYFFKMTGPSKTVSSAEAAFDKMLDGMKPNP
jgi:hypothetical protein